MEGAAGGGPGPTPRRRPSGRGARRRSGRRSGGAGRLGSTRRRGRPHRRPRCRPTGSRCGTDGFVSRPRVGRLEARGGAGRAAHRGKRLLAGVRRRWVALPPLPRCLGCGGPAAPMRPRWPSGAGCSTRSPTGAAATPPSFGSRPPTTRCAMASGRSSHPVLGRAGKGVTTRQVAERGQRVTRAAGTGVFLSRKRDLSNGHFRSRERRGGRGDNGSGNPHVVEGRRRVGDSGEAVDQGRRRERKCEFEKDSGKMVRRSSKL